MNKLAHMQLQYQSRLQANFLITGLFLLLFVVGCSGIPITYYDVTTYKQLTDLKAEATLLVESFDQKPVSDNEKAIQDTILKFRKTYEYELGKGDANSDTVLQIKKIQKLFLDDVKDYQENGPQVLGKKYFQQAAVLLGQAFDIAIATENLKNKDKQ